MIVLGVHRPHRLQPQDPASLRILLVAHTHWDREWYHPAGRFRQRLVALVDALLDAPNSPDSTFLLDGQTIVVEDYLAVRPERALLLRERLTSGALEAGPWYVLADNLIPSGEAILRNLEAGRGDLELLGARPPSVAYCPDTFGHPAYMPVIAAGYGFQVAIAWRGIGGQGDPAEDTVWWEAADGSRVLLHHLPPDGYETGSALPVSQQEAESRWARLTAVLAGRNRIGATLLPCGADHHARQPDLAQALDVARAALADTATRLDECSLADAAGILLDAAVQHERDGKALPRVRGELRNSYGYTWTLQGTFATRAHQKRRNALIERTLLHDVEPWVALAWLHGRWTSDDAGGASQSAAHTPADGSIGTSQLTPLLQHAWRTLLRTHPHDTLCGCSIDTVARAMEAAQDDTAAQCHGLRESALVLALRHDGTAARALPPDPRQRVLVRNRVARARGGIASIRMLDTIHDVPVGPGSGIAPAVALGQVSAEVSTASAPIFESMPTQRGRVRIRHERRESPQHYPDNDLVREHRQLVWVPPVPAHGLLLFGNDAPAIPGHSATTEDVGTPRPVRVEQSTGAVHIDNGLLQLEASRRGITLRGAHRALVDAMYLETKRDQGDSYTPSLRGVPTRLVIARVALESRGPLRGSCVLHWTLPGSTRQLRARTVLSLDAESDVLRCEVLIDNRMSNHRVRLVMRSDVLGNARTWADAAFGPLEREAIVAPPVSQERPPSTMPLHRWLSTCDERNGATLLSDGLAEGESTNGQLAVTLLRAVGQLSRNDLPERPGHAGWPAAIPAAQCHGRYRATVGLLLHDAWSAHTIDRIERAADELLLPLVGETFRDQGLLPPELHGPRLHGEGLRASAITVSRTGARLVLRAVNVTEQERSGFWQLPASAGKHWRVQQCRLDETPLGSEYDSEARVPFTIPARGLLTLLIARADD